MKGHHLRSEKTFHFSREVPVWTLSCTKKRTSRREGEHSWYPKETNQYFSRWKVYVCIYFVELVTAVLHKVNNISALLWQDWIICRWDYDDVYFIPHQQTKLNMLCFSDISSQPPNIQFFSLVLKELIRWEVIVCFVDIGDIVDHHWLIYLFLSVN